MSDRPNPARELADSGTPGTWRSSVWQERQLGTIRDVRDDVWLADVRLTADAAKIVRAVNALPAWADYDDAVMAYLAHQTECTVGPLCVRLARLFDDLTSKRDAVEAALRGDA